MLTMNVKTFACGLVLCPVDGVTVYAWTCTQMWTSRPKDVNQQEFLLLLELTPAAQLDFRPLAA